MPPRLIDRRNQLRFVRGIPRKRLPKGTVLVHNHLTPQRKIGDGGFWAWTQKLDDGLIECKCDWAGMNLKSLKHYRVKELGTTPDEGETMIRVREALKIFVTLQWHLIARTLGQAVDMSRSWHFCRAHQTAHALGQMPARNAAQLSACSRHRNVVAPRVVERYRFCKKPRK